MAQTLRQLTEQQNTEISAGEFESLQSFFAYYDQHYKPILEELKKSWRYQATAKRFFADDMLALFG